MGGGNKGGGKGWSQGGGGGWQKPQWSKGGGKGWRKQSKIDTSKTLWVGNIAAGVTFQSLKTHCEQAGPVLWAEVYQHKGKGTGALGYKTAQQAADALPTLS